MQQPDSYYSQYPPPPPHHQSQPPFYSPNPNPNPNFNPNSIDPYMSQYPPPDYHNYPQFPDHTHNSTPTAPSFPHSTNPNPQFGYDQAPPLYYSHDHDPNANLNPNRYSSGFDRWGGYNERDNGYDRSEEYVNSVGGGGGGEGVYKYEGGKVEPYGARGTAGYESRKTGEQVMFDDYGRPIGAGNESGKGNGFGGGKVVNKVVKAVPKESAEEDYSGGLQKFRVKVLAEGYGQTDMDVLCQVGLDGIRMLDPSTSRTLRIYPFETVMRWEVLDSYIFAFWAKMPGDLEPKRTRLKSSSYTTTTILDTVTAASVQVKEIADGKVSNSSRAAEQPAEKKKGFDWMNLVKPPNEEKEHWVPDEAVTKCTSCGSNFSAFGRRHHCRNCGEIFCDKCTQGRTPLSLDEEAQPVRVCDPCMGEVTERLEIAREASKRSGSLLSHEDLAKKLKEEMSRNSKATSGSKTQGSQTRKREVECPTCTVHLQVEVPSSGSETIECSVCQHPFLVSAH